jgi:predicted Zn-dependent protease
MSLEKSLLAAQGYIELEMPLEAIAELDALPPAEQDTEQTLQMRLFIFMKTQRWDMALNVCAQMRGLFPEGVAGYIHGAFCLHERGQTAEARSLLLSGPRSLEKEATYFYNLGCYSAVLGELETAVNYVQTSIAMDDKFRQIAKIDPDLFKLRSQF